MTDSEGGMREGVGGVGGREGRSSSRVGGTGERERGREEEEEGAGTPYTRRPAQRIASPQTKARRDLQIIPARQLRPHTNPRDLT